MNRSIIGVSADSLSLQMARNEDNSDSTSVRSTQLGCSKYFPTSILLPRFPGEPYRFDEGTQPHSRGSGLAWPPEAIADPDYGVGRLPLGMVIGKIESGQRVKWHGEEERRFSVSDALTSSIAQLLSDNLFEDELIFVIPNHWGETLQQELLDSFQMNHLRCRLLWRPIAAGLEWINHYQKDVESLTSSTDAKSRRLLSVHVGYDQLEVTELELVAWGAPKAIKCVVPGRRRPKNSGRIPGFGYRRAFQRIAEEIRQQSVRSLTKHERFARIWNRAWCSSALNDLLEQPLLNVSTSESSDLELESILFHAKQMDLQSIPEHLLRLQQLVERSYTGIVITGDLAKQNFDDSRSVWRWITDSLATTSKRILVEGIDVEPGLLPRGACRFADRLKKDLPTYLDTLPKMEMVISERGKPTWINLLESDQKWVDGGKLWERPQMIQGLSVAANSIDLKLAVAHEEFEFVREVVTDLPNHPETAENVALSVQMLPAQGKARIEIHPERKDFFGGERIFLDWRKMTNFVSEQGQTVDKQGYLNSLPRIFPELLPRIASKNKWRKAIGSVNQLRAAMESNAPANQVHSNLKRARELLREKDQGLYPQDATAFDSEGKCTPAYDLNSFMEVAWNYFLEHRPNAFIRAIAYTHTDYPDFIEYLVQKIESGFVTEDEVMAAGKCLREPEHVASFVRLAMKKYDASGLSTTWWKALSEVIRFRENATFELSSVECTYLVQWAGKVFETNRKNGYGREMFRLVCLVIVYLLRRRAFDDNFLEPESQLAEWIKSEFRRARRDAKSGRLRLMGGSVDLSEQLQLIIDYIDRQGKGQLLIGG